MAIGTGVSAFCDIKFGRGKIISDDARQKINKNYIKKQMKGLILNNAYYETPSTRYQGDRLAAELEKLGVLTDIKRNDFFGAKIADGKLKNAAEGYDFCIYLDKDKYVSYALEKCGLRLFNKHSAIQACDDKAITFLQLANCGIPMPKTLPGLLCYDPTARISADTCAVLERELGYPMIAKQCFGSLGKFVYKIDDRARLEETCEQLKCTPHLFQQFIAESEGRDIRAIVVGGKVIAAMQRKSTTDFRSNIELGGVGTPIEIDGDLRTLCQKVANMLELDYCGIDILYGKDGYCLCEVNSNAFFGGIEGVTGINIARAYAEHIFNCIK